jgi:hypothetical protein
MIRIRHAIDPFLSNVTKIVSIIITSIMNIINNKNPIARRRIFNEWLYCQETINKYRVLRSGGGSQCQATAQSRIQDSA